jgi:hypothetical protein
VTDSLIDRYSVYSQATAMRSTVTAATIGTDKRFDGNEPRTTHFEPSRLVTSIESA